MVVLTLWWFEQTHTHAHIHNNSLIAFLLVFCFVVVCTQAALFSWSILLCGTFISFLFFNIGKSPLCNASSLVLLHLVFVVFFSFRVVILALFLSAPGRLHLCLCGKKKIIIYLLRSEEVEERRAGTRKQPSWIIKRKKNRMQESRFVVKLRSLCSWDHSIWATRMWNEREDHVFFSFLFFCCCCRCDRAKCTWLRKSNRGQKKKKQLFLFFILLFFTCIAARTQTSCLLFFSFFFVRYECYSVIIPVTLFFFPFYLGKIKYKKKKHIHTHTHTQCSPCTVLFCFFLFVFLSSFFFPYLFAFFFFIYTLSLSLSPLFHVWAKCGRLVFFFFSAIEWAPLYAYPSFFPWLRLVSKIQEKKKAVHVNERKKEW